MRKGSSRIRCGRADEEAARSSHKIIDFVGDPIICKKDSEERSEHPEYPTAALPERTESGALHGNVDEIGGAVQGIGDQREDGELEKGGERECWAEMRPRGDNPDEDDGG